MMGKENILTSYLINLGEEVFKLLLAKGAIKEGDLKNAIPKDKTKTVTPDNSIKLNPSFEKLPTKEKNKKLQSQAK